MLLIWGQRTILIKTYSDHSRPCYNCKAFDLTVGVYQRYFHVLFIPCFPSGPKEAKIHCSKCGVAMMPPDLQKQYENQTRTPFYFFILTIFFGVILLMGVVTSIIGSRERTNFINSPKANDVYSFKREQDKNEYYHFAKITRVVGDTLFLIQGHLEYNAHVTEMNASDFFDSKEEEFYLRKEIKEMFENGTIAGVFRNYSASSGFTNLQ